MPSVALAPAQLCATRRTSSALSSRMAASHLFKLFVRLLEIHLHQFAQTVRIAIRQIIHAVHVHRRFGAGDRWPARPKAAWPLGCIFPPQRSIMSRTSFGRTGLAR